MRRRKKSPTLGDIGQILEAWAAAWPPSHVYRQTALALRAEIGHLQPRQLTPLIAGAILIKLRSRYAPMTAYVRRGIIQRLLGVLAHHGAPLLKLPRLRKPEPRGITATPAEIARLEAAATPALRLFLLLCWQLALRRSEALAVTPRSYNPEQHTVSIPTKGAKPRTIPLTADAEELIRVASKSGDPDESCVSILNGRPLKRIDKRWWQLANKCGVKATPHDLRRTTATALYRTTHDIRAVQQYLGHSSMVSTLHYLAPLSEDQIRQYHRLLNFEAQPGEPAN